jgi:hypothetical protein
MQTLLHAAVVSVAWVVAISKSVAVWRRKGWFKDRRVYTSWAFIVFFTLSVTFNLETFSLPFDALMGNNLSWFLCYASVVVALYFVALGSWSALESPPRLLTYLRSTLPLAVVLAILGIVFWVGIAPTPEYADRSVPRTLYDLAFIGTMCAYLIVLCLVSVCSFAILYRHEESLLARLRWGFIAVSLTMVIAFLLVRGVLACLGYFHFSPRLLHPLALLEKILEGIACLSWPIGFVSNRVYIAAVDFLTFVKNVAAVKDLREVQMEFNRRCPAVVRDVPGLQMFLAIKSPRWFLRKTDLRLHQMAVSIYDGTQRLSHYLESETLSRRLGDARRAKALHQILEGIAQDANYPELIPAYRRAARMLRAEKHYASP